MDGLHPIYLFLCRYGVNLRLLILAAIVFFAAKNGIFPTEHFTEAYVLWGSVLAICFGPLVCLPYVGALWTKITPIKDRVTYFEGEITFLASIFIGTSFFIYLTFPLRPVEAAIFGGTLTAFMFPLSLIVWALNSYFAPLSKRDTSEMVENAQQFRDLTRNFWRNILAYCASGLASALFGLISTAYLSKGSGPVFQSMPFMSVSIFILMSIVTAPFFVLIGRLLIARQSEPLGRHYIMGGIVGITFIAGVDLSSTLLDDYNQIDFANLRNVVQTVLFISASFVAGGVVFSKIYRKRPIGFEFT